MKEHETILFQYEIEVRERVEGNKVSEVVEELL